MNSYNLNRRRSKVFDLILKKPGVAVPKPCRQNVYLLIHAVMAFKCNLMWPLIFFGQNKKFIP